ncbi:alpha/beta fold hydrolase [Nonomuraea sp. NPDC046570]|uniref:alpha/beta fold hydrolase n=1 Tax=Nonomuraea sp. NPDC046570 TaxID=3155255 RepID=UPI0033C30FF8
MTRFPITVWAVAALAAAAAASAGAAAQRQHEATTRRRYPAPGRTLDADGVALHALAEGRGPAVVIECGLGGSQLEWEEVADGLSGRATVVRYDRPGFGWSPGACCDRRPTATAARLRALLRALDVPPPYVLVGHSFGGLHVRAFAAAEPSAVAGMVLVDPAHERMREALTPTTKFAERVVRHGAAVAATLAPLGLGAPLGQLRAALTRTELTEPLTPAALRAVELSAAVSYSRVASVQAFADEVAALPRSCDQLATLAGTSEAPSWPLIVLTAGTAPPVMRALHAELASAAPRGRLVAADGASHMVHLTAPGSIVEAVVDILEEIA